MRKWLLLLASILFVAASAFFCWVLMERPADNYEATSISSLSLPKEFHLAMHMDEYFYGDLSKVNLKEIPEEKISGGIVSHHLLVADEIAQFFAAFKKQKPKVIVIVGPNHFNVGKGDILVSNYSYKTPWGVVDPAEKYIDELLKEKTAFHDEYPFSREHSISALVGFINYYLPDTKIVPIIVKRNVTRERAENLAQRLNDILPKDAVVISSVDFSHHLDKISAQFHDETSVSVINSFDYDRVFSREIDSPASIYTLLRYLELRGAQNMTYKNINSAGFTGNDFSDDVTSYVFAHFIKGAPQIDKKISVLSFGDMMFSRAVEASMKNGMNPFEKIRGPEGNFLKGVDFISANLEGPITESGDCVEKDYSFKFSPEITELISGSGINIVNLANNHAGDCRAKGMTDTEDYLSKSGIDYFGKSSVNDSYIEKEINGKKIVFLGIDITIHSDDLTQYYDLIKKLKEINDYLVVNIHWGYEYHALPSQIQKDIAHALVDSGADLIIGHHPHVVQPVEIYKDKAIFYSLGNFIFDQIGKETNKGLGVGAVFSEGNLKFYLFPYNILKYQPTLLPPEQADFFCSEYLIGVPNTYGCFFEIK